MEQICSQIQIGSSGFKSYHGHVLLDAGSMYMLPLMNLNLVGLGGLGGALGGAVAGAAAHAAGKSISGPFQTTYGQLPDEVRRHPGWGRVADEAQVIVIPARRPGP